MNLTSLDIEQSFIYLMAILTVAEVVVAMFFTIQKDFNLALFYMMGALMTTQFLMIYQSMKNKRKTQAAIKLLETELKEGEEEDKE